MKEGKRNGGERKGVLEVRDANVPQNMSLLLIRQFSRPFRLLAVAVAVVG
jgi:hypothetical protein